MDDISASVSNRACAGLTALVLLLLSSAVFADAPLVDCTDERFKSGNKPDTLLGWSNRYFKIADAASKDGKKAPSDACENLISMRGDAHCQEPAGQSYRQALTEAIRVCSAPEKQASSTLVDCAEKRFNSGSSVRSLMLWSDASFEEVNKSKGTGIYPEHQCERTISRRGDAHCQKPEDEQIRQALTDALTTCKKLQQPEEPKQKMTVDCNDKRFQHKQPVDTLIKWSEMATSALESYSDVAAEAKCQDAYSYAGSAQCLLPNDPRPRKAMRRLALACAEDAERREAKRKAAAEADAKHREQIKANRKVGKLPASTYRGADAKALAGKMRKALVAGRVAKQAKEIIKVFPMGGWQTGRFTDSKLRYKKISGLVLWADSDSDGVCRYTSYNFIQINQGSWGPLKFRSFCMGCAEGWTSCPKGK